jgi:hypothetical protein
MKYEILQHSLVILGQIPTTLFTPHWLASRSIIKQDEANEASVDVITNQFSRYQVSDWGKFEFQSGRAILETTSDSHHELLLDILFAILKTLYGKEVTTLGVNYRFHFQVNDKKYIEIGNKLAPFSNWEDIINEPRLLTLEMMQENRPDELDGMLRLKVEPSSLINPNGVSFLVNNHIKSKETKQESAKEFIDLLSSSKEHLRDLANDFYDKFIRNIEL